jgi:hypothetical protein
MIDLEATFEKLEHELREVNQNAEALKKNFLELTGNDLFVGYSAFFFITVPVPVRFVSTGTGIHLPVPTGI